MEAVGYESADGFVVLGGSRARADVVASIHPWLAALRTKLIETAVLVEDTDGLRILQEYVFDSPSSAAGVVLGRSANGRTEWKDEEGATLKERQSASVVIPPSELTGA